MELDNIIYIVAVIVIFIVSLVGGVKKKKPEISVAKQDDMNEYSLNDFEKILERKKEFRQQEIGIDETSENVDSVDLNLDKNEEKPKKKKQHKEKKEEHEPNDGFDVKSAIIYSSILERKKFRH